MRGSEDRSPADLIARPPVLTRHDRQIGTAKLAGVAILPGAEYALLVSKAKAFLAGTWPFLRAITLDRLTGEPQCLWERTSNLHHGSGKEAASMHRHTHSRDMASLGNSGRVHGHRGTGLHRPHATIK